MSDANLSYTIGKYEIQEEIGRGGFATVYRATDTSLGRNVALKVLAPALVRDANFLQRFQQEARTAAGLRHPHIVTIHERGEVLGSYYIAMDLVPGPSLRERLQQDGPLPWTEALALLGQICGALDYAHQQGVVHRDLKPGNILLDPYRGAMLTDFGFARLVGESSQLSLSLSGGVVGTPAYIPVEVWEGEKATPAADVYALACIFFEMLTGQVLFAGDTPIMVMRLHDRGAQLPVTWPPGVPGGLTAVLQHALTQRPESRTPSAGEFLAALQQLDAGVNKPPSEPERPAQAAPLEPVLPDQAPPAPVPTIAQIVIDRPDSHLGQESPSASNSTVPDRQPISQRNRMPSAWIVGGVVVLLMLALVLTLGRWQDDENLTIAAAPTFTIPAPSAPSNTPSSQLTSTRTPPPANTPATALRAGSTRVSPTDGMVQVYVPAGEFRMGSEAGYDDEKPVHTVYLDAYWIDQTEVTNAQFTQFVAATGYKTTAEQEGWGWAYNATAAEWQQVSGAYWQRPQGPGSSLNGLANHPVVQVSWLDAAAYCTWAGRRLPTEAEWEKAARGTDARAYPWGNQFDGSRLNFCDRNCPFDWRDSGVDDGYEFTAPVGSYPTGASPYGALDMAGNVWEWVADWYDSSYYQNSPARNPQGPATGEYRALRGGSWLYFDDFVRAANRYYYPPADRSSDFGFRCAQE